MNRSPWLTQLNKNRQIQTLKTNLNADVVVVGAGISGLTTAYYILKNNPKTKLVLVEGGRLASGASGHNAGQVSAYLEEPIFKLAEKYGEKMASDAQNIFPFTWLELRGLLEELDVQYLLEECNGYAYLTDKEQLMYHLKNAEICLRNGAYYDEIFVNEVVSKDLESKYLKCVKILENNEFNNMVKDFSHNGVIAVLKSQKGCTNSAVLCEKILEYLQINYKNFKFYENSIVTEAGKYEECWQLKVGEFEIISNQVILCTNGYKNITIKDCVVDKYLKNNSIGLIGYMSARLYNGEISAQAYSLYQKELVSANEQEVYYYITARNFGLNKKGEKQNLVCVGGPEMLLGVESYDINHNASLHYENLDNFMNSSLRLRESDDEFRWHGLMGFTKNGVRLVGEDRKMKGLYYNLGCNGVGILTSLYGSWKIGRLLNGESFERSVFDPE